MGFPSIFSVIVYVIFYADDAVLLALTQALLQ